MQGDVLIVGFISGAPRRLGGSNGDLQGWSLRFGGLMRRKKVCWMEILVDRWVK
jgi:hypothetical protein